MLHVYVWVVLFVACFVAWLWATLRCLLHVAECSMLAAALFSFEARPTRTDKTLKPFRPFIVCHRECPTLMFVGKLDGNLDGYERQNATAGPLVLPRSIRRFSSIGFTWDRLVQTGNILTGRGSSIAVASV